MPWYKIWSPTSYTRILHLSIPDVPSYSTIIDHPFRWEVQLGKSMLTCRKGEAKKGKFKTMFPKQLTDGYTENIPSWRELSIKPPMSAPFHLDPAKRRSGTTDRHCLIVHSVCNCRITLHFSVWVLDIFCFWSLDLCSTSKGQNQNTHISEHIHIYTHANDTNPTNQKFPRDHPAKLYTVKQKFSSRTWVTTLPKTKFNNKMVLVPLCL